MFTKKNLKGIRELIINEYDTNENDNILDEIEK